MAYMSPKLQSCQYISQHIGVTHLIFDGNKKFSCEWDFFCYFLLEWCVIVEFSYINNVVDGITHYE